MLNPFWLVIYMFYLLITGLKSRCSYCRVEKGDSQLKLINKSGFKIEPSKFVSYKDTIEKSVFSTLLSVRFVYRYFP